MISSYRLTYQFTKCDCNVRRHLAAGECIFWYRTLGLLFNASLLFQI